jgi:hypothetical protein
MNPPDSPTPHPLDNTPLLEAMVAGVRFRKLRLDPTKDSSIMLEHEPTNKYDPFAVKVNVVVAGAEPVHIGYIPKSASQTIAVLLHHNVLLRGKIIASDIQNGLILIHLFVGTNAYA